MNSWLILLVLFGSAALSSLVVAVSIRLAHRWAIYDHPDGERKNQATPIPQLGGLAVATTFSAVTVLVLHFSDRPGDGALALGVLIPALLAAMVGYADDLRHLNPYLRLILQASIGLLAWVLGTRVSVTGVVAVDAVIMVVWVMVVVNGINLLDNSDGLAGATVLISAAGASVIAVMYGQILVSLLGFALVGVAVGFLWHNWFPARVYMGDSGAYFLGVLLAILTVRLRPAEVPGVVGIVIAVLLVLLPIADTAFVVVHRTLTGVHPFTAGRDHLSHVIQRAGASVPRSVTLLVAVELVSVVVAVALAAAYV